MRIYFTNYLHKSFWTRPEWNSRPLTQQFDSLPIVLQGAASYKSDSTHVNMCDTCQIITNCFTWTYILFNFFHYKRWFLSIAITFANSLDPDQARYLVWPDLDSNWWRLDSGTDWMFWKKKLILIPFEKFWTQINQSGLIWIKTDWHLDTCNVPEWILKTTTKTNKHVLKKSADDKKSW